MKQQFDTIEVVVKISERCNINCTYCYMFNQSNDEYLGRPSYMREQTVRDLCAFLAEAASEHQAKVVHVIFHGGEPMMMKPERFDWVCRELAQTVGALAHLRLSMQSNAMLVSDEWIDTLVRHDVGVGVSIDGPRHVHDADRLDHQGRGTYDQVVAGLARLQAAAREDLLKEPGAIAVIRPDASGGEVFDHLVDALGVRSMSFLLPIETHDTFDGANGLAYGRYLTEVYRAWARKGDRGVRVRFIDEAVQFLTGGAEGVAARWNEGPRFALFVVGSNGDLEPDDALKPLVVNQFTRPNVTTHDLAAFLASAEMAEAVDANMSIPAACADCCWQNGCRGSGGRLVNRYSVAKGFDNPSFLCSSLKSLYSTIARSILETGFPQEKILTALSAPGLPFTASPPRTSANSGSKSFFLTQVQ